MSVCSVEAFYTDEPLITFMDINEYVHDYALTAYSFDGNAEDNTIAELIYKNVKGKKVLDLGCGPTEPVLSIFYPEAKEVVAVDRLQENISFTKKKQRTAAWRHNRKGHGVQAKPSFQKGRQAKSKVCARGCHEEAQAREIRFRHANRLFWLSRNKKGLRTGRKECLSVLIAYQINLTTSIARLSL